MSPSPGTQELLDRRRKVLGPAYSHFYRDPVHLVRAEGVWMWDAEGRKYLDCYNNVASVGHCHPEVVEALHRQAQRLNTHTRYLHESIIEYAEMLAAVLPGDISVSNLVCTGSEANDYACQIARRVTGHNGLIILKDTYHGATTLVRDLSPAIRPDPCPDYICEIDAPDTYRGVSSDDPARFAAHHAAQIDKAIETLQQRGHGVAAVLVDSIYDGSGIFAPLPIYQQQLFTRVRAAGGLVIADEVQSGLCRLGDHYWGVMDSGVVPDIITMGKPMGDGHPLAITATTPDIMQAYVDRGGEYFNTFAGNPVSAEVGKAVLRIVERDNLLRHVKDTSDDLFARLRALADKHAVIGDLRGKGFFIAAEFVSDRATKAADAEACLSCVEWMKDNGVLVSRMGAHGNIMKIRPPLVFGKQETDLLIETLDAALARL
ncbi:aspartate aminotransferase family protein [Roseovarius atlanticus]|uniref:aspartate aminotransferase family protein n=1 Tax=Roseovarius atlanticus TaxID=1641875 RepID=UPI001C96416D|nr:aminotransferase class III-fold pyridoxal phosphate-dependent enzyme [Roseovarius atlanticus]MBY5986594.1 aminotransferase class III-fold pyridoxal phosphate-dependent enzyme [Roseovarius atlanticus]MBY6125234.1 aminotransferase class III-fold pyridoxal phosphate-dependent enzyme [Roseovarius atlanticus]MBY6150305.1 aminotransferase class III-fold pyridoxal phosphate-dependent enzyme [Roseovarius atlanticus]